MDDMTKKILMFVGFFIVLIPILFGVYKMTSKPAEPPKPVALNVTEKDWIRGNKNAKNILVEYSDLQCPACKAYEPVVTNVMAKYKDKVKLVYRHYPLPMHQNSVNASMAAESAGLQNKFWEMHDLLFEKQDEWSELKDPTEKFVSYAQSLKLDTKKFKDNLKNADLKKKVDAQIASGDSVLVNATPTFFLNDLPLDGNSLNNLDSLLK